MIRRKSPSSRLRHRLSLQQEIHTADTQGGFTRSWQPIADLWAEIMPMHSYERGREPLVGGQLQATITHKITLRYRDGITTGQRLVFDGRAFNIHSVIVPNEAKQLIEIFAEEGGAG
ncbi:MAG: phage head closure protein [Rickettsiales bacterium]|nr:phage head closure protein [Rickettsiales bacterium]